MYYNSNYMVTTQDYSHITTSLATVVHHLLIKQDGRHGMEGPGHHHVPHLHPLLLIIRPSKDLLSIIITILATCKTVLYSTVNTFITTVATIYDNYNLRVNITILVT